MPAFRVPLKAWSGAPGRTLIQGLLIHAPSGARIVHQADDVAGQTEQDVVFRVHRADNTYLGSATVKRAGHGSTCGIEPTGPAAALIWLRHEGLAKTGWIEVDWSGGKPVGGTFHAVPELPVGDPSIDAEAGLMCLRRGDRFTGYDLNTIHGGHATPLWSFTVAPWGKRFQGHLMFRGRVLVHRDFATRGASRADAFDTAGKPLGHLTTTSLGDEAEGFCVIGDQVSIVKRTGNTGPGRYLQVTPWLVIPDPKGEPMADNKVRFRGGWTCECVATVVPIAEREMIGRGIIRQSIDIYQLGYRTDVSASAGTHAAGGVLDVAQDSDAALAVWRALGVEMQRRTKAQGFDEHGHGVVKGCPHLSKQAKAQAKDWERRKNGLKSRGKITGPGPIGPDTPRWQDAIERRKGAQTKTLADWTTKLGLISEVSVSAINKARGTGIASRHVAVLQQWLTLAIPADPLTVDGIWSAHGPTQSKLDKFRASVGWTGADVTGPVGVHSLTLLRQTPAVATTNPLPIREATAA